jgi:hypothetical protein
MEEALLPLEERSAYLGETLHLCEGRHAATAVQHEPEEEREDERDDKDLRPLRGVGDGRDRERREDASRDLGPITP